MVAILSWPQFVKVPTEDFCFESITIFLNTTNTSMNSMNIGFNMVPSDPLMWHLATQLGYSAAEFQALQLIALAAFGVVD